MKKLIMGAAIAVLAFTGQSATVDWKVSYAGQGVAWSANGATVMAFAGSDFADIVKLVTMTGSDTLKADLAAKSLGQSAFSNFRSSANTISVSAIDAPSTMFWMIFTDGSWDAGKAVTWTAATDVTGSYYTPPATGTAFTLDAASFANKGTIATAAVPEPTSAMLLVLGMAGLALRRRRA